MPWSPLSPFSPFNPCGPSSPILPCGPTSPFSPCNPVSPISPCCPRSPCVPVAPIGPRKPCAPAGPCVYSTIGCFVFSSKKDTNSVFNFCTSFLVYAMDVAIATASFKVVLFSVFVTFSLFN